MEDGRDIDVWCGQGDSLSGERGSNEEGEEREELFHDFILLEYNENLMPLFNYLI